MHPSSICLSPFMALSCSIMQLLYQEVCHPQCNNAGAMQAARCVLPQLAALTTMQPCRQNGLRGPT